MEAVSEDAILPPMPAEASAKAGGQARGRLYQFRALQVGFLHEKCPLCKIWRNILLLKYFFV